MRPMSISDLTPDAPTFTGMSLDRAMSERQEPAVVSGLLDDPEACVVAASRDGVLIGERDEVLVDGDQPSLVRARLSDIAPVASEARREPILLGLKDGVGLFAIELHAASPAAREQLNRRGRVVSLREAGAVLAHPEAGLAAYVTALLNWHRSHRRCANCGAVTAVKEAGYSRRCPRCHTSHFPRTDPVVIMTVEHDGRLLLGHRAGWPEARYSVLAGFVSPGESAEEAVIREVREESGIIARHPKFVSSQPWPFPTSLMLGFEAWSDGGKPRVGDEELDAVGWFSRAEVIDALNGGNPRLLLPPNVSIARFLIDRWVGLHHS
jgi:NAD+ diphosphatase